MTTKITDANIEATGVGAGSYTAADITVNSSGQITSAASNSVVVSGGGGGPKITSIAVTNGSWTVLDDTAVNVTGGYIKITGSGFTSGCQVVVGTLVATSVSFVSSTEVRVQVPAQPAGTYTVYLTNSDGGVAIRVNGINYSSTPTWTTTSPLPGGAKDAAISIQLAASSNSTITYSLASGSTLPSGLTLNSSGLLSGTVTGITVETTYNFTVVATDQENQDTPQAFQITIVAGDPYYEYVTLHLPGTGTNLATNNTFLDGSTNSFTITRSGNTTQGTFSPFSQTGWGNYFDGTGDYLNVTDAAFNPSGAFTVEFWFYGTDSATSTQGLVSTWASGLSPAQGILIWKTGANCEIQIGNASTGGTTIATFTWATYLNQWNHFALVRNSSNSCAVFLNGTRLAAPVTKSGSPGQTALTIGRAFPNSPSSYFTGYMSNVSFVSGSNVYDPASSTITVPTTPLSTSTANQALLTCQANRFVDSNTATTAKTITVNGNPSVQAFSPFNPTASWSDATNGGSGYFDGSGDYLTTPNVTALNLYNTTNTVECWVYLTSFGVNGTLIYGTDFDGTYYTLWTISSSGVPAYGSRNGTGINSPTAIKLNEWNHIAWGRSGSSVSIWINGVRSINQAITTEDQWGAGLITVGRFNGQDRFSGYLSGLRVIKGTDVYGVNNTTITVPTAPLTAITNTSLLLNFTNAGIYDATSKNVLETVADAQISNTTAKFGSTSIKFDGTGDWLTNNNFSNPLLAFGSGDYTIEGWVYSNDVTNDKGILQISDTSGGFKASTVNTISITTRAGVVRVINGGSATAGTTSISTGQWFYFALVRSSGTSRLYINGVQDLGFGNKTDSTSYTGTYIVVGGYESSVYVYNGYIQDLRITRYARTITASPTAAFPTL